jgi:4-diphosphocytidyl-2-C-methyl-D-erythritol kinase
MIVFPNAKINIGLNILDRRPDGFHNIETVFYPLALRDALEVVKAEQLSFTSSGLEIPGDSDQNLCLKAYHLIAKDYSLPAVRIHLHKHIPIGAGLGGGSADASFLIKLLNNKFNLGFSTSIMEDYASKLGSDCSFFIRNRPVFAFEKGNKFYDIPINLASCYIVLIMPPVYISTSNAYEGIKPGRAVLPLSEVIKKPVSEWRSFIRNDFEENAISKHPAIGNIKSSLYEAGALYASMSGSGSSVYGIFDRVLKLPDLEEKNTVFYGI